MGRKDKSVPSIAHSMDIERSREAPWRTSISKVEPNKIVIRGYEVGELLGRISFSEMVYLIWKGELPSQEHAQMMDMLLAAGCEHSIAAPSTTACRYVASSGVPLQAAVAAGILAIGEIHGGAIEQCAKMLVEGVKASRERGITTQEMADLIVRGRKEKGERLWGYGHPLHTKDPRTERILDKAYELGIASIHTKLAKAIEGMTERYYGKTLPLNLDGAIAAIMVDMGFDWRLGKGFFIVSRTVGLVAHAYEEGHFERPYRSPSWREIEYIGPASRELQEK